MTTVAELVFMGIKEGLRQTAVGQKLLIDSITFIDLFHDSLPGYYVVSER